jgi:DNA-binding response OmpR family regulator
MAAIKVLVIDDNKAHAEGLAELLNLSGFESSSVFTGLDGVEMAEKLAVDAVLLDMGLPDIKGSEVCRRLRANPATTDIAIIFHTGTHPSPGSDHPADAFLTYPIAMADVSAVIRGCVERRRAKAGMQDQPVESDSFV